MIKREFSKFLSVALHIALVVIFAIPASAGEAPRISPDALKSMLGGPDLVIVDVRSGQSWEASERKIKGALREDPKDVESWADKYPKDLTLVLY